MIVAGFEHEWFFDLLEFLHFPLVEGYFLVDDLIDVQLDMQSLAIDRCVVSHGFLKVMTIKQSLPKHIHENAIFQELVGVGS